MNDEKTIGTVTCVFDALYAYCLRWGSPRQHQMRELRKVRTADRKT